MRASEDHREPLQTAESVDFRTLRDLEASALIGVGAESYDYFLLQLASGEVFIFSLDEGVFFWDVLGISLEEELENQDYTHLILEPEQLRSMRFLASTPSVEIEFRGCGFQIIELHSSSHRVSLRRRVNSPVNASST